MTDESVWQFPCRLQLKIVGDARPGFADELVAVFARQIPGDYSYRETPSSAGKYVSVTVPVSLQNKAEVEALYAALKAVAGVKMVL